MIWSSVVVDQTTHTKMSSLSNIDDATYETKPLIRVGQMKMKVKNESWWGQQVDEKKITSNKVFKL